MKKILFILLSTFTFLFASNLDIQKAYSNKISDLQVQGHGKVVKVLRDDTKGIKHQRFILKINNSLTVLVAHNIDLSPRVSNLNIGDRVEFFGEYEWNRKGGVIHWTHHDPRGRHVTGWIKHKNRVYK
ncbi:DUF3465 domain-containing protein [Arcobacter sp. YIC-464]|uniref:DUF3465 domain-containing protein n=1 Tax=Arcobacter sp. YIC-464 TaxID=3376631 RepID=UPI003C241702